MLEPVSHFEHLGKAFTNHNDNSAILQRIYFTQTAHNRKKITEVLNEVNKKSLNHINHLPHVAVSRSVMQKGNFHY